VEPHNFCSSPHEYWSNGSIDERPRINPAIEAFTTRTSQCCVFNPLEPHSATYNSVICTSLTDFLSEGVVVDRPQMSVLPLAWIDFRASRATKPVIRIYERWKTNRLPYVVIARVFAKQAFRNIVSYLPAYRALPC